MGCGNYRELPKSTENLTKKLIRAVRHIVTRWHYNETLALTLTVKLTVIYVVKDDTKTKLHLMLYIKVILLGKVAGL